MAAAEDLAERAERLIALRESGHWPVAKGIYDKKLEQTTRALFTNEPMSESELGYLRGFGAAIEWCVQVVELGEQAYKRAIAKQRKEEAEAEWPA